MKYCTALVNPFNTVDITSVGLAKQFSISITLCQLSLLNFAQTIRNYEVVI